MENRMFPRLPKIEEKFHGRMRFDPLATHPSSESRVKVQVFIFSLDIPKKDFRTDKTFIQFLEERLEEEYSILESNPECCWCSTASGPVYKSFT